MDSRGMLEWILSLYESQDERSLRQFHTTAIECAGSAEDAHHAERFVMLLLSVADAYYRVRSERDAWEIGMGGKTGALYEWAEKAIYGDAQ